MRRIERIVLRHLVDARRRQELEGAARNGPLLESHGPAVPGDWMPLCRVPRVIESHPRRVRASGGAREALDRAREAWEKLDMQLPLFPLPLDGPEAVRASQLDRRR